jgi:hypothetical protein
MALKELRRSDLASRTVLCVLLARHGRSAGRKRIEHIFDMEHSRIAVPSATDRPGHQDPLAERYWQAGLEP